SPSVSPVAVFGSSVYSLSLTLSPSSASLPLPLSVIHYLTSDLTIHSHHRSRHGLFCVGSLRQGNLHYDYLELKGKNWKLRHSDLPHTESTKTADCGLSERRRSVRMMLQEGLLPPSTWTHRRGIKGFCTSPLVYPSVSSISSSFRRL
ncbi:hypothetical protein PMAYCL1PPCAC_28761, partial [Pristionchus mayeri]